MRSPNPGYLKSIPTVVSPHFHWSGDPKDATLLGDFPR